MENKETKCPHCKSLEVIKWGKRNTDNRGKIQRYKCKSCSETFVNSAGSVESAYALMKGIEIFYNFVKKHEALKGKTPSELAIPSLQFKTENRGLELINSTTQNN